MTTPGVYIEEIPSGPRTIAAAPTSIAAFVGCARRGPTDRPLTVRSVVEFERAYGGLWAESAMSYAVRHFFMDGGTEAVICRVHREGTRDAMTVHLEQRGAADDALRQRLELALRTRLGVEITVVLESPGALAALTQVESRQKPIRLLDERKP